MDSKDVLKKYCARIGKEGWLKSLMCGLVVGFFALVITAAVCWYIGFKGLWLYFLVLAAVTAATTPLFYCKVYRSTVKRTARRLDALGLEERLLTMTEMENDDSYIAKRQREDAMVALNSVNEKLLKFAVSTSLILTLAVSGAFGIGMTTYASVSNVSGKELFAAKPKEYRITYQVTGQGSLIGNVVSVTDSYGAVTSYYQIVKENESALPVMAEPAENWLFVGWSDGYGNPYRADREITEDTTLFAVFEQLGGLDDLEEPSDQDTPSFDLTSSDDDPSDKPGQPNPNPPKDPGDSDLNAPADNIIDGDTNYGGSNYDNAYGEAMGDLSGDDGEGVSDGGKDIITDYFDAIAK